MIEYDRYAWWQSMFSFRGTVLPRVLGRVGVLTGLTLGLCLLNTFVLPVELHKLLALDQLGHSVFGVALGLFVVFRTNSAYARFWEARSRWGELLNASRNLARTATAYAGPADDLGRLITAFALALRLTLRGERDFAPLRVLLPESTFDRLAKASDPMAPLARGMSDWVAGRLAAGRITPIQAAQLEGFVSIMVDCQGGCEKIRRTPLPFVYAAMIKQSLLVYLLTLPFVLVDKMGFAAPLVVAVVSFGFLGIEEAGVEIENPFEAGPNNLPLEAICGTIASNVAEAAG